MSKKVLLISPRENLTLDNDIFPRLGILGMGTILKKQGHVVRVVHMTADKTLTKKDTWKLLEEFKPDIVGITLSTYQTRWTKIVSKLVKDFRPDIPVVIGGPHPSALKEKALEEFPDVDTVVVGEGEKALPELVRNGYPYKGIIKTEKLENLDSLPFPDLSFINLKNFSGPYPMGRRPSMSIIGSRGCPNHCIFCCKVVHGTKVRYHSPEYVVEHIQYLESRGVKEACFEDDQLNINLEWLNDILEGILRRSLNKRLDFRGGMRVDEKLVDLALLNKMKRAGFKSVFYGVESGNQEMLDRMKKGITLEEVRRAVGLTNSVGLRSEIPFIVGLPGETEETIKDSIKFLKELKPYITGFARAMPFPGTPFHKEVLNKGYILQGDYDEWSYIIPRVRTDSLSPKELEKWEMYCNKIAVRHLMVKCLQNPQLLIRTVRGVGLREVISKVRRNLTNGK